MTRTGIIGEEITLGAKFYQNGVLFDPEAVYDVEIYDSAVAGTLLATLTPTQVSTGYYTVTWTIPSFYSAQTLYDQWSWVATSSLTSNTQRYSFTITEASEIIDTTVDTVLIEGSPWRPRPSWPHRIGLIRAESAGNGIGVIAEWDQALPANASHTLYYNLYRSSTRYGVFASPPYAITTTRSAIINVPKPGNIYYLSVRATEFDEDIPITELEQEGLDLYLYPDATTTVAFDETLDGYSLQVDSVLGYPSNGELLINYEVMKYDSLDQNTNVFNIVERGLWNTFATDPDVGDTVELFRGIECGTSVIKWGVTDWINTDFNLPQNDAAIGQVYADEDGYRIKPEDDINTDLSAAEEDMEDVGYLDTCGYRRDSIAQVISGQCVGSYSGGTTNGYRGFNLADQIVQRLDYQLQVTGQNAVLLSRRWTGRRCSCISLRREAPRERCPVCYGTGYAGGYDRRINTRSISDLEANTFGYFKIRVSPYKEDVALVEDQGFDNSNIILTAWTLPIIQIRERDIIVLFDQEGAEAFRYEVQDVTRNVTIFGMQGNQQLTLMRLNKTSIIYTFDISI